MVDPKMPGVVAVTLTPNVFPKGFGAEEEAEAVGLPKRLGADALFDCVEAVPTAG